MTCYFDVFAEEEIDKKSAFPQKKPLVSAELKNDDGKARWDLLPFDAIEDVAKILTSGATIYGERSWERGMNYGRLIAATLRHISAWSMGEDRDAESGVSHISHAACNLLFLSAYLKRGIGTDDRSNKN